MWLFTRDGFLSIVEHEDDRNLLLVRSRFNGHIENIFGRDVDVQKDAGTDYEYRAEIKRERVAKVIGDLVLDIDYGNFKEELHNKYRFKKDRVYLNRIWAVYESCAGNFEV